MFKVASRFLLPTELFLGAQTFLWGLAGSGVFWQGALYKSLERINHDEVWGVVFCGLGTAMSVTAALEWFLGRIDTCIIPMAPMKGASFGAKLSRWIWSIRCYLIGWTDELRARLSQNKSIHRFVSIRCTIAFLMMGAWIGGVAVALGTDDSEAFAVFYPSSILYTVFSAWIYVENLRVRYALDDRYETPSLRFER